MWIERGTAHHKVADIAAKGLQKGYSCFLVDYVADSRHFEKDAEFLELGRHTALEDLFHYQRNGDHDVGLHLFHSLEKQRGRRGLAEVVHADAAAEGIEELVGEAVDVAHREHAYYPVLMRIWEIPVTIVDGCGEAFVAEHYALRGAGSAGSVVDYCKVLVVVRRIGHRVGAEASGEF